MYIIVQGGAETPCTMLVRSLLPSTLSNTKSNIIKITLPLQYLRNHTSTAQVGIILHGPVF